MESNVRKGFKYLLLFLAFVTALIGFVGVTLWNQIFTPSIYKDAFEQSGFYQETTNIIEDQVIFYLENRGKELVDSLVVENLNAGQDDENVVIRELSIWVINTVIENQTPVVVETISERIDLEGNIQSASEAVITGFIGWVRGEIAGPKIFSFIPSVEEAEKIGTDNPVKNLVADIAYSAFGLTERPQCSSSEAEVEALQTISSGRLRDVSCTTDKVREASIDRIMRLVPAGTIEQIESDLNEKYDLYGLKTLFEGVKEVIIDLAELKEGIVEWRTEIQAVRYTSIGLVIVSFLFTLLALIVSKKRTGKMALKLYLLVGISMMITGFIFNQFFVDYFVEKAGISDYRITSEAITAAQSTLWTRSLESAVQYVFAHLYDLTIEIGFMLTLLTGIPLLFIWGYNHGGKEKLKELVEGISRVSNNLVEMVKAKF